MLVSEMAEQTVDSIGNFVTADEPNNMFLIGDLDSLDTEYTTMKRHL